MGLFDFLNGRSHNSNSRDYEQGYSAGRWDSTTDQPPADIWGGNAGKSRDFQRGYTHGFNDFDILNDDY